MYFTIKTVKYIFFKMLPWLYHTVVDLLLHLDFYHKHLQQCIRFYHPIIYFFDY